MDSIDLYLRGEANPLAHWAEAFDGAAASGDAAADFTLGVNLEIGS